MTKLTGKILINGTITAVTGIRVGGSSTALSIGGLDNTVVRNPISNKPYIPGSSLKGKMRSLIELSDGTIGNKNGPSSDPKAISTILFGSSSGDDFQRPSKLYVRDCDLLTPEEKFQNSDLPFTEVKTEVAIDRITSKANPRQIERVPAGAEFALELMINVFDEDSEDLLIKNTLRGLKLVQDDSLGGSGSRGSGKVVFKIASINKRTGGFYAGEEKETDIAETFKKSFGELF